MADFINNCDIHNTSTWRKYREGLCEDCYANCCALPTEVTIEDLIRLGITDEYEAESSLKKVATRLKKEGIVKRYNNKTDKFLLVQMANLDCYFLDAKTRKCSVYENRPQTCRDNPKNSPRIGYCPYLKKKS